MGLKSELEQEVGDIFSSTWKERDGQAVPTDDSLTLGNDAVKLDATVLYADLSDSTKLVDAYEAYFAAEIYKSFLRCSAKIIRAEGGAITAYDGDRIMAVFIGGNKNTSAVRAALKINWAAKNIIRPASKKQYPNSSYVLKHVVGVDTSPLFVARSGIRGANDLVWIGRAANYAAKLCALSDDYPTRITKSVYDSMHKSAKFSGETNMWQERVWTPMNNMTIYRSTYWWSLS